jgi:hypothetical protein
VSVALLAAVAALVRLTLAGTLRWSLVAIVVAVAVFTRDATRRKTAMTILGMLVPDRAFDNSRRRGRSTAHLGLVTRRSARERPR